MDKIVDKCSKCENYVVGVPLYSSERKVVRSATKQGVNYVLKITITLIFTIIGFFFGGIGAIPGFIIGLIVSLFFGNKTDELVNEIDKEFYTSTPYKFECPRCGNIWEKVFSNKADTVSDEILMRQKNELANSKNRSIIGHFILFVICGVITFFCVKYCYMNDFTSTVMDHNWLMGDFERKEYHWGWLFRAIIAFVTGILTLYSICTIWGNWEEKKILKKMSISEFRNSEYRYGYIK